MRKNLKISRDAIMASICRDSFYEFLKAFWHTVVPEKPVYNWHMKVLCDEMQKAAERVFKGLPKEYDIIINVPPGTSKSTICSVMFPAWVWTRMPSARCICGSYSATPLSTDLSRKCRDVIKSDLYIKLFPEISIRPDQDTKTYFANTDGGMRYSVGTGGSVTGMHAHFILVDDPMDPQMATSDVDIKNANEWLSETLSQRKVDKAVTLTVLIMQRLHQSDPTGYRLKQKSAGPVRHLCFPAELSENVKPEKFRKFYGKKGLLDAKRLSKTTLKLEFGRLGEFGYAGQMMQTPVPRGGAMFKVDKLLLEQNGLPKYREEVRFWDKAGTAKGGAFTVGVKMGIDYNNEIWVLNVVRGQWDAGTRENIIKQTANLDGYLVKIGLEQEPGSAGKESAQNTVKNLLGWKVEADPATGDKETRADTFATQVNAGLVHVLNREWTQEYIDELRYFPMSTYKDQVDASSGAIAMLSKPKIRVGVL